MADSERGGGLRISRSIEKCGRRPVGSLATAVLIAVALISFATRRVNAQGREFRVIVHESNPVTELSAKEISRLFLKKIQRWSHGLEVLPIDQEVGSAVRESFSQTIHRRGASAIRNFWQQEIYSGRGVPPPQRRSDEEIVRFVRENPSAIGYVSAKTPVDGVKILKIIE